MALTDQEYAAVVADVGAGRLLVGIDAAVARKLFTQKDMESIRELTGEAPRFESAVVSAALGASWLALFASFALALTAFGSWAWVVIPVTGMIFFIYMGHASIGHQRFFFLSLLILAGIAAVVFAYPSRPVSLYALAVIAAFWFARLTYVTATMMLRAFVLRNKRAFELLEPVLQRR